MITTLLRRRIRRIVITLLFFLSFALNSGVLPYEYTSPSILRMVDPARAQLSFDRLDGNGIQSVRLDNGLVVLMKPIHTSSTINVDVVYSVGSTNEGANETGVAHLLEHMLFLGTKDRPIEFGRLFRAIGDEFNATTQAEQTDYFHLFTGEEKIGAILALEADRMLNTQITDRKLAVEKEVVVSELIERYAERPSHLLVKSLFEAAYPDQARKRFGLATKADIRKITRAQVEAFYKKHYTPGNATVIIAGNFDADNTLSAVKAAFGPLKNTATAALRPANPPRPVEAVPMAVQAKPLALQLPKAPRMVGTLFALPSFTHPDSPALELLMDRVAKDIGGTYEQGRRSGWYYTSAVAKPEQTLETTYEALQQSIAEIVEQPMDASELAQAKEAYEASRKEAARTAEGQIVLIKDFWEKAGDYRGMDDRLAAINAVRSEDILRAAQTYLDSDKAVAGFLEPLAHAPQSVSSLSVGPMPAAEDFDTLAPERLLDVAPYLPPIADEVAAVDWAQPEKVVLENGLQLLLLPNDDAQKVVMRGWVDAGDRFDPQGKRGVAYLTAKNLETTPEDEAATAFSTKTNLDGVNLSAEIEPENLMASLETIATQLRAPAFTEEQLGQTQKAIDTYLSKSAFNPDAVVKQQLHQLLYPEGHPAHAAIAPESINTLSLDNLRTFYKQHYRPDNTILVLVGKFDSKRTKERLAQVFETWSADGAAPEPASLPAQVLENNVYIKEPLVSGSGALTVMGQSTIARSNPNYYALEVADNVLGAIWSGRLSMNIRNLQGLAYRAQSILYEGRERSELTIDMSTPTENVERAVVSAIAVLKQLKAEGITASELQSAQRSLIDTYFIDLAYPDLVAEHALNAAVNRLDEDELRTYPEKIRAVTLEDVQTVLDDLIEPDKLAIVTTAEPSMQR